MSSCLFVASFDAKDLPRDAPLRVVVKVARAGVTARTRGRMVLQSPSTRLTSRLLAAFAAPDSDVDLVGVRAQLVPTGFESGAYRALLQISVPGTALPGASWNLGATLISRDRVRTEVAGRVSVGQPGVPAILEREVRMEPGSWEIVPVGHETATGFILSDRLELVWPDPNRHAVSVGPITLLQPIAGAFMREGRTRVSGSLARAEADPVQRELPTALVGLICHGRRRSGALNVERSLVGVAPMEFPALEFDAREDRCVQFRDLVPPDAVDPGTYRYEVRVKSGEDSDAAAREFVVLGPGP